MPAMMPTSPAADPPSPPSSSRPRPRFGRVAGIGLAGLALVALGLFGPAVAPAEAGGDVRVKVRVGGGYGHHHHHHHVRRCKPRQRYVCPPRKRHVYHHHHVHRPRTIRRHHVVHHYPAPRRTYCPPPRRTYHHRGGSGFSIGFRYSSGGSHHGVRHYGGTYRPIDHVVVPSTTHVVTTPVIERHVIEREVVEVPTARPAPPVTYGATPPPGWADLAAGRDESAKARFGADAGRYPDAAGPKLGYAVVTGLEGDLDTATWALRRSLAIEARALREVPVDDALAARLAELRNAYEARIDASPRHPDAHLGVAALSLMLGDVERAMYAHETLVDLGDDDRAVVNLGAVIAETAPPSPTSAPAPERDGSAPAEHAGHVMTASAEGGDTLVVGGGG